jgi:hypothetical protein
MSLSFVLMLKGAFTGYQMIFLFFVVPFCRKREE